MYRMLIDDNILRYSGAHEKTIVLNDNLFDILSMFLRQFGVIDLYKKNNIRKGQAYTLMKLGSYDKDNMNFAKLRLIVEKSYLDIVKETLENEGFVKKEEGFRRQLKR